MQKQWYNKENKTEMKKKKMQSRVYASLGGLMKE